MAIGDLGSCEFIEVRLILFRLRSLNANRAVGAERLDGDVTGPRKDLAGVILRAKRIRRADAGTRREILQHHVDRTIFRAEELATRLVFDADEAVGDMEKKNIRPWQT